MRNNFETLRALYVVSEMLRRGQCNLPFSYTHEFKFKLVPTLSLSLSLPLHCPLRSNGYPKHHVHTQQNPFRQNQLQKAPPVNRSVNVDPIRFRIQNPIRGLQSPSVRRCGLRREASDSRDRRHWRPVWWQELAPWSPSRVPIQHPGGRDGHSKASYPPNGPRTRRIRTPVSVSGSFISTQLILGLFSDFRISLCLLI